MRNPKPNPIGDKPAYQLGMRGFRSDAVVLEANLAPVLVRKQDFSGYLGLRVFTTYWEVSGSGDCLYIQ